jgi:hypothetical protein
VSRKVRASEVLVVLARMLAQTEPEAHKTTETTPYPGECVWCDARRVLGVSRGEYLREPRRAERSVA